MKDRRASRAAVCIGGGALVCFLVACAPEARYRVLSFIFDGVPPPPGMRVESPISLSGGPAYSSTFNGGLSLAARGESAPPKVTFLSVHKPVAENKCTECHDSKLGFDTLPPHDARLCDKCHLKQREKEGWNHGPINLGTCIPCHVPHRSRYEHLLSKPIPDLCLTCHQEDLARPEEYHDVTNVDDCIACHDPHRMY